MLYTWRSPLAILLSACGPARRRRNRGCAHPTGSTTETRSPRSKHGEDGTADERGWETDPGTRRPQPSSRPPLPTLPCVVLPVQSPLWPPRGLARTRGQSRIRLPGSERTGRAHLPFGNPSCSQRAHRWTKGRQPCFLRNRKPQMILLYLPIAVLAETSPVAPELTQPGDDAPSGYARP